MPLLYHVLNGIERLRTTKRAYHQLIIHYNIYDVLYILYTERRARTLVVTKSKCSFAVFVFAFDSRLEFLREEKEEKKN